MLRFVDVRHSPKSFTVDVFVADPDMPAEELTPDHPNFVGTVAMYGHGEDTSAEDLDRELEPFDVLLDLRRQLRDPSSAAQAGTLVLLVKDQAGRIISPEVFRFGGVSIETRGRDEGSAEMT